MPAFAKSANATENSLIGSGRSLSVENNYGYQDPFGPHTGAITRPGFARMDTNKRVNGCGLVSTNHTESAPSVGTKALHDNLAWTGRSGLPHLARSSHGIGAETPVRRGRFRTEGVTTIGLAPRIRADTNAGLRTVDDVRLAFRQMHN